MTREEILNKIKESLRGIYGARLRGVVLYGSEARGEAHEGSDIDILVLLQGPVAFGQELKTIIHALYPLQLEILGTKDHPEDRLLDVIPVDVNSFETLEYGLYINARREGVFL